ncbi:MAG TPA: hypothetical protein DCF91_10325 [Porphyromonadaceae bacterium]|nr:hypothetical protein [Porphyromonadaceae bacterium]
MKRSLIITGMLLIYLAAIGYIAWPGNNPDTTYPEYFIVMGVSLAIVVILNIVLRKRELKRKEMRERDKDLRKK